MGWRRQNKWTIKLANIFNLLAGNIAVEEDVEIGGDLTVSGDVDITGGITNVETIQFDTAFADGVSEGRLQWDIDAQTLAVGMPGGNVNLQIGQENLVRVKNTSGVDMPNGTIVRIDSATGIVPLVTLADNSSIATVNALGWTTEDIDDNSFGYVTTMGLVRGDTLQPIDTDGMPAGTLLWLGTSGTFTDTRPTSPTWQVVAGTVIREHASEGVVYAIIIVVPQLQGLSDVYMPTTPTNEQIIAWDTSDLRWENKSASLTVPVVLTSYTDLNRRNLDQNLHGGLDEVATAQVVSNGVPANITVGLGKVVLSVIAGADTDGTITITGTSVDRNTGAETGSDTDTLTIAGVTTDGATTDAEGNTIHGLTNAYITSKWFKGAIVISTTDVNLSDFDVYVVAFEQFNDTPDLTLQTLDATLQPTNAAAWVYMYLYTVKVTDDTVIIANVATLALASADSVADRFYRLRKGQIAEALDGTTDGVFLEIFLGPDPQQYISQMTIKVWADLQIGLTLT
jgi:hypothetical protein